MARKTQDWLPYTLTLIIGVMFWLLAQTATANSVVVYEIDSQRTRISFNWSYFGMLSPPGSFSQATGWIYGNLDDPMSSSVEVAIPVRTLKTFMPAIDNELLNSGDFFKPDQYPIMRFRSDGIMHVDKREKTFSLTGTLTVNGISKPVILSTQSPAKDQNPFATRKPGMELTATTRFRRSEFGMTRMLGVVGDDMQVKLKVVAVEKSRQAQMPPITQ